MRGEAIRRAVLGTVLAGWGCGSPPQEPPPTAPAAAPADVVARVNGAEITADDLRLELARKGADFLDRFDELKEKRAVLDDLVREELLAGQARKAGLDKDPEVVSAIRRVLAERFWRERSRAAAAAVEASEEDVRGYYDGHREEFSRPERRRAAVIEMRFGAEASESDRIRAGRRADQAVLAAKAQFAGVRTFGELAQQFSDDAQTKLRGGDIGWLPAGVNARWDAPVVEALFKLEKPGDLAGPIEGAHGVYLVKLVEMEAGAVTPLDEVHERIAGRLTQEKRARVREELYGELKGQALVEVDDKVLERVGPDSRAAALGHRPPAFPVGVPAKPGS